MHPRRTIRKPTRWTPDEWRQIEELARARGVPPLRYVREAALAGKLPPRAQALARSRQGPYPLLAVSPRSTGNTDPHHRKRPCRTIRKPTRWTPDEWRQIENLARARGVPPLRYVREAALAGQLPPRVQAQSRARRGSHELVRQLKRVLNNLNQLRGVAEGGRADAEAAALESVIATTETAVVTAAVFRGKAGPLIAAVLDAGRALNELTHGAHIIEELPHSDELGLALCRIIQATEDVQRA